MSKHVKGSLYLCQDCGLRVKEVVYDKTDGKLKCNSCYNKKVGLFGKEKNSSTIAF